MNASEANSRELFQVVYHATAPRPMTPADLAQIAAVSRKRNEPDGITGMLLYGWQQFVQVIEGPAAGLLSLLGRIGRDERCSLFFLDVVAPITRRSFPEWAMLTVNMESAGSDARFRYAKIIEDLCLHEDPAARTERFMGHLDALRRYTDQGQVG